MMRAGERARPTSRAAVELFLSRLTRTTLVVGKGGVGKTTCATAIAARLAASGENTLLVSTDPAAALGPALGVALEGGRISTVDAVPKLSALQLDAATARTAFLARWRDVLVTIVDRGTYLDADDITGLVDAAFPGADEIFGLLVLAELLSSESRAGDEAPRFERLVIDTAPTGHTLRLLALPATFQAMIGLLESMQSKHRFMVQALTHRYRQDAADVFLDEMRRTIGGLGSSLGDRAATRAVLVTRAEPVVVDETIRYAEALGALHITVAAVVVEAVPPRLSGAAGTLDRLRAIPDAGALFSVPAVAPPPTGWQAMAESLGAMVEAAPRAPGGDTAPKAVKGKHPLRETRPARAGAPAALLRTLTIVGGKGGVGKTTVACAFALSAALDDAAEGEILLVSTDPAPSIGDALGITARRWAFDAPEVVPGLSRLYAWQMDAAAAFQSLRDRYEDRIDAVFDGLMGRSMDLAHDRAIIRDLLSFAPPGIDEIFALASLGEALAAGRYARIIVDPAPTGHLLRLLELPTLAIDWSHRLMRLIMKYKEIAGLGDAAADLVNFSRRTRALDALLHDATRAGVVLVSLDEPAVIAETTRLTSAIRQNGVAVIGAVRNRVSDAASQYAGVEPTTVFEAPLEAKPLVGIEAIRDWSRDWIVREPDMAR